jgi:hypothetical protein
VSPPPIADDDSPGPSQFTDPRYIRGPFSDDHGLDVLAISIVPPWTLSAPASSCCSKSNDRLPGSGAMHVDSVVVESRHPLALALDGELDGNLPGQFETVPGAVRVVTPVNRSCGNGDAARPGVRRRRRAGPGVPGSRKLRDDVSPRDPLFYWYGETN